MKEAQVFTTSRQCVGIDIAKLSFTACVCRKSTTDELLMSEVCEFANNKTGFNQMVKWSRKHLDTSCPGMYLMEATGVYYEELAYHLHTKVKALTFVVLPNKAKAFSLYQGIWTKTDEMDCQVLAQLGAMEPRLRQWTPPSQIYRDLRSLCRFATELTKLETQMKNHLEALENSACPEQSVIKHYRDMLKDVQKRQAKNETAIKEKVASDEELSKRIKKIATIPGVGFSTIVAVIAETNGFELITSRKQLASYAGFDVIEKDSGTSVKGKSRISKKGNSRIRAALYFPAMVASRFNYQLKEDYSRIVSKHPDIKKIGVTAIQRKLLLLIYTLWKSGEEYDKTK